jgi:predicted transcriptional regulator
VKIKPEAAMTDEKQLLSDELLQQIEDCAREQNRKPSEVLEEAVRRYMALRRLERLAERGEERVRARGIREEDVPGLVQEVRQEKRVRGR